MAEINNDVAVNMPYMSHFSRPSDSWILTYIPKAYLHIHNYIYIHICTVDYGQDTAHKRTGFGPSVLYDRYRLSLYLCMTSWLSVNNSHLLHDRAFPSGLYPSAADCSCSPGLLQTNRTHQSECCCPDLAIFDPPILF